MAEKIWRSLFTSVINLDITYIIPKTEKRENSFYNVRIEQINKGGTEGGHFKKRNIILKESSKRRDSWDAVALNKRSSSREVIELQRQNV